MTEKRKLGVFLCHCGGNISDVVDVKAVRESIEKQDGVVLATDFRFMCSNEGQERLQKEIRERGLDGVVVACCTPKMYEDLFRQKAEEAGMNPYLLEIANIREQCSYAHRFEKDKATEKAKVLVRGQVEKVRHLKPLEVKTAPIQPGVAVIGAGIAGIHASLLLANLGHKVTLIEKSPTIGGNMARTVKTFPTDDCAMCTLSPKMNEVYNHERIDLVTYAEVKEAKRSPGKFTLVVEKKPRYVTDACIGCNRCTEKCPVSTAKSPVSVESEWDQGLTKRKAIYLPFPQALPQLWTIDADHCFYFQRGGKCRVCAMVCPAKAIDFTMKPERLDLEVGAVIVATGYQEYDPTPLRLYGFGREPNVLTQMQVARMLDSMGPTKGTVSRPSDGRAADSIVMVQCVGSRGAPGDPLTHEYCSRVCCMVAVKHAQLIKKARPDTEVYVLYNDLRAYGKGFEEYYVHSMELGVKYVRGLPGKVRKEGARLLVDVDDMLTGRRLEIPADVVVLSAAMEPTPVDDLLKSLKLDTSPDGFVKEYHAKINPTETAVKGVFVAGCAQGPKDITDSISQAGAAAMSAAVFLGGGEMTLNPLVAEVDAALCRACDRCMEVCEFDAVKVDPEMLIAVVDETACEGCGKCTVVCPTGAISVRQFTKPQIVASIDAMAPMAVSP
ncbi:MAG TPA: CoB--CoM heterodisulfide reductase iron-sulfur subunit A family protein [Thermoplasmata archaeon]|nr:CoB--CoM heterodisulfide reductase iron-sulfur subunit A family protein [Thermoplasmata archaeon]